VVATIDNLARLGLIEDLAFARWWVEQRDRHAPRGRRLLEAELRQHGVHREVIEHLRDELEAAEAEAGTTDGGDQDAGALEPEAASEVGETLTEEHRARVALSRHLRGRPVPTDPKGLQRLGMFLVRRGFEPDTARAAIRAQSEPAED
jgi:SOS response regulatory protein OraA/RecX